MRNFILLMCGLLLGASVQAADNGIYIGAGVGQADVELDTSADFSGDDLGFKVIAGIRPLDWLAFEANYVNFGEPDDNFAGFKVTSEGYGLAGYAVGLLALGPVDAFAKAGVAKWNTTLAISDVTEEDFDGTDFAYGVGVQFRLLSIGIRAEYEVFDMEDDVYEKANMLSVGITYTFL